MASRNDWLIEQIIKDWKFDIREDGTVWRVYTGHNYKAGRWRDVRSIETVGYGHSRHVIKYKYSRLIVSRIIFRKFIGQLLSDMVIDHIDGNSLNDHVSNLQQITYSENTSKGR
jgi:HNH endonuclease